MKIVAHRGGSYETPENTLAAFANALSLNVDEIELDVHLSKDGVPVVIHDETLDRTTNATGPVRDRTVAELRQVDAGRGEYVPTLEEVLQLIGDRTPLTIEIKAVEAAAPVVDVIRAFPSLNWSGLSSLPEAAATLRAAFPEMKPVSASIGSVQSGEGLLALLNQHRASIPEAALAAFEERVAQFDLAGDLDRAVALGSEVVIVYFSGIDADLVASVHARGLEIGAWTVNDPAEARRLMEIGVDRLTTDDPRTMQSVVAQAIR